MWQLRPFIFNQVGIGALLGISLQEKRQRDNEATATGTRVRPRAVISSDSGNRKRHHNSSLVCLAAFQLVCILLSGLLWRAVCLRCRYCGIVKAVTAVLVYFEGKR